VGEIVTGTQIQNLPLNGRQFGNLAALVPGVGLGFHPDPTKSTQFAPQVAGGTGRNINYLIDGGDNNDDTVGGMVQNFPLDSVGEFNFVTQRFKAEYGRSYGGVLQVVTKSGTNDLRGSVFNYFRDKSLNAQTETEKLSGVEKGDYRKYQFGASLGGPIKKDKTHFFMSFERVQQDTTQAVDTLGLFPDKDGVFDVPFRENLAIGKITHQLSPNNYLSVRYGYNNNSQPYGASPQTPLETWGTSANTFHSANLNLNSVLSGGRLNEFLFQYSYFHNHIGANSDLPTEIFPNGVTIGQNPNTPQDTLQHKYQFRDDFTWNSGRHEFKVGVMFINEPTLDITFSTGQQPTYTHIDDLRNAPITTITQNGPLSGGSGFSGGFIPNKQYGAYVQDSWHVGDKLTLDIGVRYDYITGFAFDQSANRIFNDLQAAGRAGLLAGAPGFEDFGADPKEDKNNIAPRAGFIYDAKGDGSFVIRGGAGRYYDFPYTNATLLFPIIDSQSSFGEIYFASNSGGLRNPDGTFFQVGQPLPPNEAVIDPSNAATNAYTPLPRQPYTDQVNLGFSVGLGKNFAVEVDGMATRGRDQGRAMALNVRPNLGPRRFAGILPNVGTLAFTVWVPENRSSYKGVSLAVKKRWDGKTQLLASYTLSQARSTARNGTDEFGGAGILDAFDPFNDAQFGPSGTDARHRVTISGVWMPGAGFTIAPIFRYRSKLPYNITAGLDLNRDNNNFDLPPDVETTNAGRGAEYKQLDLRVSKRFHFGANTALELIAEGFNLTNSTNPGGFIGNRRAANFGEPTLFAGDFQRGEQRMAQLGVRLEF
jgi:TonB-dependent receptor-like protein